MDIVRIFDTTLRDGEQSPGFSMSVPEKVRMARQLESLGVDIIESGFPIASAGDLEGVRAVCREIRSCTVAALARARRDDIDAALEGLAGAAHPRLHTFLATSDLHLQHKLRLTREEALEAISNNVRYAREHCAEVEFSAEDASRTEIGFLCEAVGRAVRAGATIINLPDTVGYAVPEEYAAMFRRVIEYLDGANGITLSAHCHDDLGLGVANSLAAVQAGVRQLELTINGIGERAGNAALEEVVVAAERAAGHAGRNHQCPSRPAVCYQPHADGNYGRACSAQQGRRRRERVRPRSRHPPGRHPQESPHLRNHLSRSGRRSQAATGSRKTFRAQCAARDARRSGLSADARRARRMLQARGDAGRCIEKRDAIAICSPSRIR